MHIHMYTFYIIYKSQYIIFAIKYISISKCFTSFTKINMLYLQFVVKKKDFVANGAECLNKQRILG